MAVLTAVLTFNTAQIKNRPLENPRIELANDLISKSLNFLIIGFPMKLSSLFSTFLIVSLSSSLSANSTKIETPRVSIDKESVYELANLARFTYSLGHVKKEEKNKRYLPSSYIEIARQLSKAGSSIDAIAYLNEQENRVVIAYKGTQFDSYLGIIPSFKDLFIDFGIVMQDLMTSSALDKAISDAHNFYLSVKEKAPQAKIYLTGDSMGGYLAIQVSMKTGEQARVFSSPGIVKKSVSLNQVVNFVRKGDPVNFVGEAVDNTVYFDATSSFCPISGLASCHGLDSFMKYALNPETKVEPTQFIISHEIELGYGLN